MKKFQSLIINILIFSGTLTGMLFLSEYVFRKLLFSKNEAFNYLRDPGFYSDYLNEDDYWKLYYLFGKESRPPENPHPLLGWTGNRNATSFIHNDAWKSGERRPVLLYGDSYAQCMPEADCFEDFLSNDTSFPSKFYFLNYGVGGFG